MFSGRFPDGRFWLYGSRYQNCTDFSNCTYPCGWLNNTYAACEWAVSPWSLH
eukprot:SAG11_NODE_20592_length_442_cov_0.833819_1_plen_51_part_10